jgi:hypothetical protein
MGTHVGVRPFRASGVRLESELIQGKLIIHNYGYGGSGLTLSFGGAKKVLEIIDRVNDPVKDIAVLGGGVAGLSVAYDLLKKGHKVTLYSENWHPNLTSNIAAGMWTPLSFPTLLSQEKQNLHKEMLEISKDRFKKSTRAQPEFSGIKMINHYSLTTRTSYPSELVVIHFDNGVIKKGFRDSRIGIDTNVFMEDLYSKVKTLGAVLHQMHFKNLEDVLRLNESIIINCMSYGSSEIFNDQEFIPVRGHLVYLEPQEGIDYSLYQTISGSSYSILIHPWGDRIILGGVFEQGENNLIVNPNVINKMIQNAHNCLSGKGP